jgi:hypothetical protein
MISQQAPPKTVTLTARSAAGATRQFELRPDQGVFAGRSANCGLQLPGAEIADIHCRIGFEDGRLYVQNWMSAEGIRVNGNPMSAKTEVAVGDVIQIGEHRVSVELKSKTKTEPAGPQKQDKPIPVPDDPARVVAQPAVAVQQPAEDEEELAHDAALLDVGFLSFEPEETYDAETVALLRAEIEELQAALAQRDAELHFDRGRPSTAAVEPVDPGSDEVLSRLQELVDEANRSDERVAVLEEMLHTSEAANRNEQEERHQLEAWVGDIEQRIGQRETEHKAELEALRERLEQAQQDQVRLQKQLQQAAFHGNAPKHYEETLEKLQTANRELHERLADSERKRLAAEQKLGEQAGEQDRALREERASIAQERAQVARVRFELSRKLSDIDELPKAENQADRETAQRIRTLREHLREIHEQEKQAEAEAPLRSRLARLWKRVEY